MLPGLKWYGHGVVFFVVWSTFSYRCHGGEALPTNDVVHHVQGGEMINMVRCLEPMVDF